MTPIDGENVTINNAPRFLESDAFKDLTKAELMILAEQKDETVILDQEESISDSQEFPFDSKEWRINELKILQKKIFAKAEKGQEHHKAWFKKKIEEFKKSGSVSSMTWLDENFDFTDNKGLIIHTRSQGVLKFAPKQATYDDIKDIDGIELGKNVRTENEYSGQKGLWVNGDAIEILIKAGKKIGNTTKLINAINCFPSRSYLDLSNETTNVGDFFDLLGYDQYGISRPGGDWGGDSSRRMWLSDGEGFKNCLEMFDSDIGQIGTLGKGFFIGVWFLED